VEESPRRLSWREVEALTGGFDEARVVGRGGFSAVYLARLRDGAPVAVKVQRWCCGGERRLRAFRQEPDLLRRIRHPQHRRAHRILRRPWCVRASIVINYHQLID